MNQGVELVLLPVHADVLCGCNISTYKLVVEIGLIFSLSLGQFSKILQFLLNLCVLCK